MQYTHSQKYIRMSPTKLRYLIFAIKKMTPTEAVEKLSLISKAASEVVGKTIAAALANAKVKGADEKNLKFASIQVGEGPRLKRGMAVSRGRWHPIVKKMSHLTIVLETIKSETRKSKTETKQEEPKSKTVKTKTSTKQKGVK